MGKRAGRLDAAGKISKSPDKAIECVGRNPVESGRGFSWGVGRAGIETEKKRSKNHRRRGVYFTPSGKGTSVGVVSLINIRPQTNFPRIQ